MNVAAFETLLTHRPRFLSFVRARGADREAAEDLLQHAFTKVIEQPADNVHGRSVVDLAKAEGLTTTNAYVRLHRARRLLGERLRALCRSCADNACVDCHCKRSDATA